MSSCNDLMNELKKCLFEKNEVRIEQIYVKPIPSLFDKSVAKYHYKTNIFKLGDKFFICEDNKDIKQYLCKNNLQISKEDYPYMYEGNSYKNNIIIKQQN